MSYTFIQNWDGSLSQPLRSFTIKSSSEPAFIEPKAVVEPPKSLRVEPKLNSSWVPQDTVEYKPAVFSKPSGDDKGPLMVLLGVGAVIIFLFYISWEKKPQTSHKIVNSPITSAAITAGPSPKVNTPTEVKKQTKVASVNSAKKTSSASAKRTISSKPKAPIVKEKSTTRETLQEEVAAQPKIAPQPSEGSYVPEGTANKTIKSLQGL